MDRERQPFSSNPMIAFVIIIFSNENKGNLIKKGPKKMNRTQYE
jgi:hypothetical protein